MGMAISAAKGFLPCIYAWGFMYICNMYIYIYIYIVGPCASLYTCSLACTAKNAVYEYVYRTSQNFRDRKISRIAAKGGGRNIRDKNTCEGGSGTLRNTITWLQCL